jgi:hypothetical protein
MTVAMSKTMMKIAIAVGSIIKFIIISSFYIFLFNLISFHSLYFINLIIDFKEPKEEKCCCNKKKNSC